MGSTSFFNSRPALRNTLIALLGAVIFIWFVFWWLGFYTLHGETITVPDFKGVKIAELDSFINGKDVKYLVIDSIFEPKSEKGVVIRQDPEATSQVKKDRTIYLYVSASLPPQISMPKLQDKSLRQAVALIESYGLRLGKIKYVSDQCNNCIIAQMVKGKKADPGMMVEKGTVVDLTVGKGLGNEQISVPNLIGMTKEEAVNRLMELTLTLGSANFDNPKDSVKSLVYKQFPSAGGERYINEGASVDIFLTANESKLRLVSENDSTSLEE